MENRTFACENAEQLIKLILSRRSYRDILSQDISDCFSPSSAGIW